MDILKNKKFVYLWSSQILSQLTINMLSFLILIRLYETTGSTIAVSLLWIAYSVPAIIVGPFAAAATDLVDKRRVLMVANLLQALTVLGYAIFLYKKLIFLSYGVVFMFSLFNQFYVPAEAAALALMVDKEELAKANGLFFITQQSALVIGFGIAGILSEIFGFRPTVIATSLALFLAFFSVSLLPAKKIVNKIPKDFEKGVSDFFNQIIEGYMFIKNTKKILMPFLLLLGVQVILAVVVTNLPPLATQIMKITPGSSGFLIVLPAGIGAVAATALISKFLDKGLRKRRIIIFSLAILTLSMALVSILLPIIPMKTIRIIMGVILFFLTGLSTVGVIIPSITYMQEATPKDLLGRVFGNFWFLTTVATVLPILFSATLTEVLGVQFLILLLSAVSFIVLLISRYKVKEL